MTINELLNDEALRNHEFPVTAKKIFLAHAGVSPLPRRVAEAIRDCAVGGSEDDQEAIYPVERIQATRQLAATFLRTTPEEIAFVGPTSLGLSFVASGFPVRKGDNILIYFDDYPSNVYPWMALAAKGVEVRLMNIRERGRVRKIDVLGQVDEQTRLVALASCNFLTGWRIDVAGIGKQLHRRGIAFCLDGIQTLGAFPTSLDHVDFLAADAHKWLLGPNGAGVLYVRKSLQETLRPHVYGWNNVLCPNFVAQEKIEFQPNGQRFEPGSLSLIGLAGLEASFKLLLELGIDNISNELLRKRAWLVPALQAKGYAVLGAEAELAHCSGIITFRRVGSDMAPLQQKLKEANIVTSLRADRIGNQYIRISPHFYNTDAELHRFLEQL